MIPENHYISQHVSGNQEVETAITSDRFSQTCPRTRLRLSAGCPGLSRAISIPSALSNLQTTTVHLFPRPDVFPFSQYPMRRAEFLFFYHGYHSAAADTRQSCNPALRDALTERFFYKRLFFLLFFLLSYKRSVKTAGFAVIFLRTRLCPSVFPNIRAAALFAGYIYHIFILLLYLTFRT